MCKHANQQQMPWFEFVCSISAHRFSNGLKEEKQAGDEESSSPWPWESGGGGAGLQKNKE